LALGFPIWALGPLIFGPNVPYWFPNAPYFKVQISKNVFWRNGAGRQSPTTRRPAARRPTGGLGPGPGPKGHPWAQGGPLVPNLGPRGPRGPKFGPQGPQIWVPNPKNILGPGPGPRARAPGPLGPQIWAQISGFGPDVDPKWPPACRGSVRIFARVCLLFGKNREVPWRPQNGRKRRKIVKNRAFVPSAPPTGPYGPLRASISGSKLKVVKVCGLA